MCIRHAAHMSKTQAIRNKYETLLILFCFFFQGFQGQPGFPGPPVCLFPLHCFLAIMESENTVRLTASGFRVQPVLLANLGEKAYLG